MSDEINLDQMRYAAQIVQRMLRLIPLVDGSVPRYAGLRDELDGTIQYVNGEPLHHINWVHYLDTLYQRLAKRCEKGGE